MRLAAVFFLLLALAACSASSIQPATGTSTADAQLVALYEGEWLWRQNEAAMQRDDSGEWVAKASLPDVSAAAQQRRLVYWESALAQLDAIEFTQLSADALINAAVFRQIVKTLANDARYKTYEAPLNSDSFFWSGLHPQNGGFADAAAYRRYLGRLRDLPRFFAQHTANMRAGLARGYTVPAVSLSGRERSLEAYLLPGSDNPFWIPFDAFPTMMADTQRERLQAEAREVIATQVVPAYTALLQFMREEYLPGARTTLAARDLPDGDAFYQSQIEGFTTLDLTAEEIHNTGLREVERIRAEMELILAELDYQGDMADFFHFLRTDPQFYAKTPDELMGYSAYVAKRMDGKLSEVLGFLPRRRFAINPVPPAIAPIYTGGRGGLNACLMNTYNLPARPLYTLPAFTLHECAPGHA
ncbi:MAG: DUF885 family protein, partial [Congregibacter sp.]|nr:DUF885 family protein [Congregibacter sp.]